jgi:hypothetical protein
MESTAETRKLLAGTVLALGLVATFLCFNAGSILQEAGDDLTTLRSRGGETVAEHYYQQVGQYGRAYARLAYAAGLGSLLVSVGLAGLLLPRKEAHGRAGGGTEGVLPPRLGSP